MASSSGGILMFMGPFMVSDDGGETWHPVPDHPEIDDAGFVGFSLHGIAGDLFYHSGDDGLWVGAIVEPRD